MYLGAALKMYSILPDSEFMLKTIERKISEVQFRNILDVDRLQDVAESKSLYTSVIQDIMEAAIKKGKSVKRK